MEDITHHQRTYRHDSYIMFLVMVDVELNGPSGRMVKFWMGPRSPSTVFFRCSFFGNLFSESSPFSSHVQPLSLPRSATNSRPYPQTHILIWIGWALWWTDSINRMGCIIKPTSLFRKIHHLFRVSKGLKKQSCLRVCTCATSCLICNDWRHDNDTKVLVRLNDKGEQLEHRALGLLNRRYGLLYFSMYRENLLSLRVY